MNFGYIVCDYYLKSPYGICVKIVSILGTIYLIKNYSNSIVMEHSRSKSVVGEVKTINSRSHLD